MKTTKISKFNKYKNKTIETADGKFASQTEADRERAIKMYVENNSQDFHKYVSHTFIAVIFINGDAEIDHQYILIDEYNRLKNLLLTLKIPFMVVHKERSRNKPNGNPFCFGDRKLIYEKK